MKISDIRVNDTHYVWKGEHVTALEVRPEVQMVMIKTKVGVGLVAPEDLSRTVSDVLAEVRTRRQALLMNLTRIPALVPGRFLAAAIADSTDGGGPTAKGLTLRALMELGAIADKTQVLAAQVEALSEALAAAYLLSGDDGLEARVNALVDKHQLLLPEVKS